MRYNIFIALILLLVSSCQFKTETSSNTTKDSVLTIAPSKQIRADNSNDFKNADAKPVSLSVIMHPHYYFAKIKLESVEDSIIPNEIRSVPVKKTWYVTSEVLEYEKVPSLDEQTKLLDKAEEATQNSGFISSFGRITDRELVYSATYTEASEKIHAIIHRSSIRLKDYQ